MQTHKPPVIVLMTDFGLQDPYVGIMKGVISTIAPHTTLIDLTHGITAQNVLHGAIVLATSYRWFPGGSIFISVVDPGVGTTRRALLLETSSGFFIAPDNGLLAPIIKEADIRSCHAITNPDFMLPNLSTTFHGRDLFAPAAAHIAAGVPPAEAGPEISPVTCAKLDVPVYCKNRNNEEWYGEILYADIYGNLVTSIPNSLPCEGTGSWLLGTARSGGIELRQTYGDVEPGEPVAYRGSAGYLELAVRNGNAATAFQAVRGDRVTLQGPR